QAGSSPQVQAEISLLAAASDGANLDLVARALNQPVTEDMPLSYAWYLLGLATRSGSDATPYRAKIIRGQPEREPLINQFDSLVRGNPEAFEAYLLRWPYSQRIYVYAAAVIASGEHASPKWRDNAKRLLFASERPYFR